MSDDLSYFGISCTLKPSPARSSSALLLDEIAHRLDDAGCTGSTARVADHDVRFGVTSDEGDGDDWPELRARILAADLFVVTTPIWLGHPASVCQMVLERLDAFLGEDDDRGRMISYDRVALVGVVGNEDGAHHVGAELFQGLNDVGFTLAATAMTYWVGEAMQKTDFQDVSPLPEKTLSTADTMVRNAVHLARRLRAEPYPAS
jgi:multimeric flavodoxin WrbA